MSYRVEILKALHRLSTFLLLLAPLLALAPACNSVLLVGRDRDGSSGGADSNAVCQIRLCGVSVLACGDCVDNDADGLVDSQDPDCLGPCHDSESAFLDAKSMQANRCTEDCYFDGDLGPGNDGCNYALQCDPLRDPLNSQGKCGYDPAFILKLEGTSQSCTALQTAQTPQCLQNCLAITPNGCDCFGCCKSPHLDHAVWIGSEDASGNPTCNAANLADPNRCRPCTQVSSCLNLCEGCEVCFGSGAPAIGCTGTQSRCTQGQATCGQPGELGCPGGSYCLSGCCVDTSASNLGK